MNIFPPEQIALMKAALAEAANDIRPDSATKALMAEQILRAAGAGGFQAGRSGRGEID